MPKSLAKLPNCSEPFCKWLHEVRRTNCPLVWIVSNGYRALIYCSVLASRGRSFGWYIGLCQASDKLQSVCKRLRTVRTGQNFCKLIKRGCPFSCKNTNAINIARKALRCAFACVPIVNTPKIWIIRQCISFFWP